MSQVEHLRVMLREQLLGDEELLREHEAGYAVCGEPSRVRERIALVRSIARQVGGLHGAAA